MKFATISLKVQQYITVPSCLNLLYLKLFYIVIFQPIRALVWDRLSDLSFNSKMIHECMLYKQTSIIYPSSIKNPKVGQVLVSGSQNNFHF